MNQAANSKLQLQTNNKQLSGHQTSVPLHCTNYAIDHKE